MNEYKNQNRKGFREFTKNLKENNLGSVLLLTGQERFLFNWAVESLVKKFVAPGFEQLDFVKLSDVEDSSQIIENVETATMISEKRVVWVDNYRHLLDEKTKGYVQKDIENLREYLGEYRGNNIIVFSFDDLGDKASKLKSLEADHYDFDKLAISELNSFIKKRIKAAGKEIDKDTLGLMVDLSGYYNKESDYRLFNLIFDIEKILAYSDGNAISSKDVEVAMNGDLDTFVFDFIDALDKRQKDKSFSILHNMLRSGANVFQLVSLIGNQFELMLEVLELEQEGLSYPEIVKEMGIHEFRVKKAIQSARRFGIDKLKDILNNLYEIDTNVKTGNMEQEVALELFVAKI